MRILNMKRMIGWLSLITLFTAGQLLAAEQWTDVEKTINKEEKRAVSDAALTRKLVKMDRGSLMTELKKLKRSAGSEEHRLNALKAEFEGLLQDEDTLIEELAVEHEEVEAVEGTVRSAVKDAASVVRDNHITPEFPKRHEIIEDLLDTSKFPGMEGIKSLVDLYFEELEATGTITRRSGDYVAPDGRSATGEIIRVGRFTSYFRATDGSVGFLRPESSGERMIGVPGEAPGSVVKAIKNYFADKTTVLPVDPSGGAAFAQMTESVDLKEKLEVGGILMWPILFVAALAFIFMIERLIVLGSTKANTDKIMGQLNDLAEKGKWKEARDVCELNSRTPTCRMLNSAIKHIGDAQEVLEGALQEAILREMPRLERFLPTLSILAMVSPLLGLLGTVTGMINVFQVITVSGTGDPRMLSGGISEALLTTQFGLIVAVPIMLVHHFLERRVDKIANDMEEKGTGFAVTILKSGAIAEGEA
ncbi:MAG: MotA/TolQ/ExbB proton channel family protein [Deltaproteobacteria bacterium]|nr:MotA/TolQ/ExbB proton channel family protein [Deltaproteobacteria bacterium]